MSVRASRGEMGRLVSAARLAGRLAGACRRRRRERVGMKWVGAMRDTVRRRERRREGWGEESMAWRRREREGEREGDGE